METQKTPKQRMELATSELLRAFNGPETSVEYISRLLRLSAEGMQDLSYRTPGSGQQIAVEDLSAVAWLASVQTIVSEINNLENSYEVPFDIKRPEWYEKERLANS